MRDNPGSSILTWVLIAGGAYLAYEWWKSQGSGLLSTISPGLPSGSTGQTNVGTPGTINSSTGGTTVGTSNPPPVASLTSPLGKAFINTMTSTITKYQPMPSTFSGFQWDYYAKLAFGTSKISLSQLGLKGENNYSLNQYAQAYLNITLQQTPMGNGIMGLGCCDSLYGMGSVSMTDLMYNKMANRKGWAVGDFNVPKVGKYQGYLN